MSNGIPAWEDFAAFGDMGELEHVCYMFEEAAEEGAGIAHFAGGESHLIKQLLKQHVESFNLLEQERPGLYQRTWMAEVINSLFVRLDALVRQPQYLPHDLHGLLLDFHKVMIAAHEIYDPRSRAKLVAKAACEAADGAIANRNKEAAKRSRASKGIEAAIHWAFRDGESAVTKTAEWVWRKLEKYDEADALECGDFSVFVRDGELRSIYRSSGKPDGRAVKRSSFDRPFRAAKESFALAG